MIIRPEWILRLGLGLMYFYSGYDLVVNPRHWYGFVPKWFSLTVFQITSVDQYLLVQGIAELVLAALFLGWFFPVRMVRYAAALSAVEMALILLLVGIDPITFRDIGLLGAAVALFIFSLRHKGRVT